MTPSLRSLPGEPDAAADTARMLRVNHAGEYGAMRIYKGQLDALRGREGSVQIRHMAEQERTHFDAFNRLLQERRVRPTLLMPLWHVAGYALGAATALMGKEAAMACTVAVETVIDEHYAAQEKRLAGHEPELAGLVARFRAEELEHRDTGINEGAEQAPLHGLLNTGVKAASRLAIWLSTRV